MTERKVSSERMSEERLDSFIKRCDDMSDDGSFTVVIDHWPSARALPPVDGLEVVELIYELREQAALLSDPTNELLSDAAAALSQASSVIAGLERHNQALLALSSSEDCACAYDGPDDVCLGHSPKLKAAEARISSLEEENKRLREALRPFAFQGLRVDLDRFDGETQIEVHFPRVSPRKAIPCGFVYVEDVLAARQTLGDHNG